MISKIKECFVHSKVLYSRHAKEEMLNEPFGRLKEYEVYEAVINGEIIEHYPSDKPYPSFLILGRTGNGRNVHVVCAYAEDEDLSIVITVYQPDPELWIESRERRISS